MYNRPFLLRSILSFLLVFTALSLFAQNTEVVETLDPFLDMFDPIYSVLVLVSGYLSIKIPILNKISDTWLRVATISIILGIGFVAMGSDVFSLLLSFATSSGIFYQLITLVMPKTPKLADKESN